MKLLPGCRWLCSLPVTCVVLMHDNWNICAVAIADSLDVAAFSSTWTCTAMRVGRSPNTFARLHPDRISKDDVHVDRG